jgi:hypothetical protein
MGDGVAGLRPVGMGERVAGLRPGKKRKHNPAETVKITTDTSSEALSRCQSPSDLIMGEKVEVEDLDPFGLNEAAFGWLKAEEKYYKSRVDTTYIPGIHENSVEGILQGAFQDYARRSKTSTASPVLLVSTNVGKNWMPPESVGKGARFLVFPQVVGSPLFLTYLHARAGAWSGRWLRFGIHWALEDE